MEKDKLCQQKPKQTEVALVMSDKIDFKLKTEKEIKVITW
jgi:hypothetical protein